MHRGCGDVPNNARRFYHSGETSDLAFVFDALSRRHPDAAWALAGVSLADLAARFPEAKAQVRRGRGRRSKVRRRCPQVVSCGNGSPNLWPIPSAWTGFCRKRGRREVFADRPTQ